MLKILQFHQTLAALFDKQDAAPDQQRDQRPQKPAFDKFCRGILLSVIHQVCPGDHKKSGHCEMADHLDEQAQTPQTGSRIIGIQNRVAVEPDHTDAGQNIQNIKI